MAVGWWSERVVPRIVDRALDTDEVHQLRDRACAVLSGDVLEVGFGSGLNVPFYPAAVTRVAAVEPADVGWELARKRLTTTTIPVQRSGLDGQSLPFPDDSFDAALSTWTMCTIPDAATAVRELRRVLKPGGELRFMEHLRAKNPHKARLQRWLDRSGGWPRLAGGCHCARDTLGAIEAAGFGVERVSNFDLGPSWMFTNPYVLGSARLPPDARPEERRTA